MPPTDPALNLPTPDEVRDGFNDMLDTWKGRNELFRRTNEYINGQNKIPFPEDASFVPRPVHTYLLQGITSEKSARFSLLPDLAVVPSSASPATRSASTRVENALNSIQAQMEMRGDGDVWSRVVEDAIVYDQGVERIDAAPNAFWQDLVCFDNIAGSTREPLAEKFMRANAKSIAESAYRPYDAFASYKKYREEYKQKAGVPLRSMYVSPDSFYPRYDGPTPIEAYQREERSYRSVVNSPLFKGHGGIDELITRAGEMTTKQKLGTNVVIIHYVNQVWHAYFALCPLTPRKSGQDVKFPDGKTMDENNIGKPVLLYAYPHNLGRLTYNIVGGRHGGWKTDQHRIEGIMRGLCDLVQDADTLSSQVATYNGELYWPTLVETHDPEYRDSAGNGPPKPTKIPPGKPVAIWKGESIAPMFTAAANPLLQWYYANIINQVERLSGAAAIYGQQDPGVRTGFHAHLQISQSEHLDDKIEGHLTQGAVNRADIIMRYVKQMNERLYGYHKFTTPQGQSAGRYVYIDPADADPSPELDASVRKPRPVDFDAALRAALTASQDRSGPGTPLLDDDTILERLLGEQAPDVIKQKIAIQNEQRKLLQGGVLTQQIGQQIALIMAKQSTPDVSGAQAGQADPALLQALQQRNAAPQPGGVSPQIAGAVAEGAVQQGMPPFPQQQQLPPASNLGNVPPQVQGPHPPSAINGQGGGTPNGNMQPEQTAALWQQIQAAGRR